MFQTLLFRAQKKRDVERTHVCRGESSYLCEESQGVVGALGSHLSDQVLGAIFQQLLLNGVPTLQPGQETYNNVSV